MTSMKVGAPAIGIDLGYTNSYAAVWQHNQIEIIPSIETGNRTIPSCVGFTDDECLVGEGAKNQSERNPANTIFGWFTIFIS